MAPACHRGSRVCDSDSNDGFANSEKRADTSYRPTEMEPVSMYSLHASRHSTSASSTSPSSAITVSRVMMVTFSFSLCASALSLSETSIPREDGLRMPFIASLASESS